MKSARAHEIPVRTVVWHNEQHAVVWHHEQHVLAQETAGLVSCSDLLLAYYLICGGYGTTHTNIFFQPPSMSEHAKKHAPLGLAPSMHIHPVA